MEIFLYEQNNNLQKGKGEKIEKNIEKISKR